MTEERKTSAMTWVLRASFVVGILILVWSLWDLLKIPTTPTAILWGISVTTIVIVIGLFLLATAWPGGEDGAQQRHSATDTHNATPARAHAPAGGHGHGAHDQQSLAQILFSALILLAFGALMFAIVAKVFFGPDSTGTGGSRSVAHSSRLGIPADACTHVPDDAQLIVAPVGACSAPIVIDRSNAYVCSTPGQTSGLVRTKNWYGPTEPDSWESGNGPGDHTCVGSTSSSSPVTVRVWTEQYQPIP